MTSDEQETKQLLIDLLAYFYASSFDDALRYILREDAPLDEELADRIYAWASKHEIKLN